MISMHEFWRATSRNYSRQPKHLGQNMSAAGSLTAANYVYGVAKGYLRASGSGSDRRGEKINVELRGGEVEKQIREVINQPREVV
jgi:hypothetical protein